MAEVHVLLTATVKPAAMVKVDLSDPAARLAQYRAAFSWWAKAATDHGFGILLAENSGVDTAEYLDAFEGLPAERFRLFTPGPSADDGRGKGALEADLIESAIRGSDLGADDSVYKVTGRLTIANPGAVFRRLPPGSTISRGLLDNTRVDMRCFGATTDVWMTVLAGMGADVDERRSADLGNVVAARILTGQVAGIVTRRRFPTRPQIRGSSGTTGKGYGHTVNRLSERLGHSLEKQLVRLAHAKSV